MSDAFFGRLVPSEDLVIKTANLVVALKKVSADDINGLGMKEGPAKFKLPSGIGNIGGAVINAKVRRIMLALDFSSLNSYRFLFVITVTSLAFQLKRPSLKIPIKKNMLKISSLTKKPIRKYIFPAKYQTNQSFLFYLFIYLFIYLFVYFFFST